MTDAAEERRPIFFRWGKKADLATIVVLLPLIFVAACFGEIERGMTAACGCAVLVILTRIFWKLHGKLLFWFAMFLLAILHVLIALYFPWARNSFSAFVLLPFGAIDFALTYACVRLLEWWLARKQPSAQFRG